MRQPRLCLLTQTPLVRFLHDDAAGQEGRPLHAYRDGEDYTFSPGGVTRMVHALLGRLRARGHLGAADWLSLASQGPASVALGDQLRFHQVRLPPDWLRRYARAKGALWETLHGLRPTRPVPAEEAHEGLSLLARAMAGRALRLHQRRPFDLVYVHDFQLLPLAEHLPRDVPRVFRWHIPVADGMPADLQRYVATCLDRYDAVIVSTEGYAQRLRRMGVRAPVHASYPYLDESRHRVVTSDDVARFRARWGLAESDVPFLVVARLDPMKSQDVAIRALARLRDEAPDAKLLVVGGGGFSGGRAGLGLPQASTWRGHLESLARELGVGDRVVFTGGIPDADVDVAFTLARAVLLPSQLEGFGLAAVEGWLYGRPVLVSRRAGVAELVEEGENGHTFDAGDDAALAARMLELARDEDLARHMGAAGRVTARACHLRSGADDVWRVLSSTLDARRERLPSDTRRH